MLTDFKQSHFILYQLVLPYCTTCSPVDGLTEAWHTPVTCEESSDDTYSLWFTSNSAPIMQPPETSIGVKSKLNSSVFRVVSSGSEATPELKPGEGMASRGTISITMKDFEADPGPINFSEDGTFFGKLKARNVLDGKKIISHYYTISGNNETPQLINTSTHFITNSSLSDSTFKIQAKDALKDLESFSQQFPIPTEARLTTDIDSTATIIPVDDGSLFSANDVIIIDEELMRIQSVSSNNLTVHTRGDDYTAADGTTIYKTEIESHSVDSSVQICYVMNKTFLSNVLQDIYNAVDLSDYVNFTQWDDEIREWNENAFLYGVFHTPDDADSIINQLLTNYMIDMWLDQGTQKAVVSATTAWKQSIRTFTEGSDFDKLRTSTKPDTRFSRAYIYNKKDYQARNDDETNYSQLTLFKDTATEVSDFYGSVKLKEFDPSNFITPDSAFILTSRYVQRFSRTPEELNCVMEERKLAGSGLGDVVDFVTRDSQTPSGEFLEARVRAQLVSIKPNLNGVGRTYNVKALSYVPLIASSPGGGLTIFISGNVFDVNLYARAGGPPNPIDITFIFDGATIGSTSNNTPSIRAGQFDPASNIKLIFTNNSKTSAIGGKGGDASVTKDFTDGTASTTTATNGGDCYQSDGINTEIYLNYGEVDGFDTDGEIFAAGGGGASSAITAVVSNGGIAVSVGSAASGGGGSGIPSGIAGTVSGFYENNNEPPVIVNGFDGNYTNGGGGVLASDYQIKSQSSGTPPITTTAAARANSQSGNGGASLNGIAANADIIDKQGTEDYTDVSIGAIGLAGGSIKGANVTLYNLAADASKFKAGNSDSFTLIDA